MDLRLLGVALVLAFVVVERTEGWSYFCQIEDVAGLWRLSREISTTDDYEYCWSTGSPRLEHYVYLSYPDIARDGWANYGHWTLVYGLFIEVTIHGRRYFGEFPRKYDWRKGLSVDCRNLKTGTSHDILTNNYACFEGRKLWGQTNDTVHHDPTQHPTYKDHQPGDPTVPTLKDDPKTTASPHPPTYLRNDPTPTQVPTEDRKKKFKVDHDLVARINGNDLGLWEAEAYGFLGDLTEDEMIMMAGGNMSTQGRPPKAAPVTEEQLVKLKGYPASFDWRNVDGVSYVSPVRNQGYCGSCYAFAALAAYEARVRIMTKNTLQPLLSPQDIVECGPHTYGCYGGWVFTEGKYAEELGFLEESCNPYSAENGRCNRDSKCLRYYGTNYQYVGGYFGGSNDILMMDAILENGPLVVSFAVYHDFFFYRRGVYYHSGPNWLMGYHAVAVVGWGKDPRSGTKYWIAKNSWGKRWGEDGYFRIVRGNNDCDLESTAFETFPII